VKEYEKLKELSAQQMHKTETELYAAQHKKTQLLEDKKRLNAQIGAYRSDNAGTDRKIKQQKHFNSKRENTHKLMNEEFTKNTDEIKVLNEKIIELKWKKN